MLFQRPEDAARTSALDFDRVDDVIQFVLPAYLSHNGHERDGYFFKIRNIVPAFRRSEAVGEFVDGMSARDFRLPRIKAPPPVLLFPGIAGQSWAIEKSQSAQS